MAHNAGKYEDRGENMNDWITYVVELQPLSRKLEEHLNRREYHEASEVAMKLETMAFNARMYCAVHMEEE